MSDELEKDKQHLSRRAFLLHAGKEAVNTGTQLVPGGNLARKALGMEVTTSVPWWNVLAKWRQKKTETTEISEEQETGTDNG